MKARLTCLLALLGASCAAGPRPALGAREPLPPVTVAGTAVFAVRTAEVAKAPVRIAFGGDIHGEEPLRSLIGNGVDLLEGVRPALAAADIVMVNLETAVTDRGEPVPREFSFNAPLGILENLKRGGVHVVNLANNHTGDYGTAGLVDTIERAHAAGLITVGAGRNAAEAYEPQVISVRGVTIGFMGLGRNIPRDAARVAPTRAGQADGNDADFAAERVRAARAKVDVLVVMAHMGVERSPCPTSNDRAFVQAVIDAGATIFVGNHPHVLQGIVADGSTLVMYSNGNFVFYPTTIEQRTTGVLVAGVDKNGVVGHEFIPAYIGTDGRPNLVGELDATRILDDLATLTPGAGVC